MSKLLLGIDLGGTKINGVLVDGAGRKLASLTLPTEASEGTEAVYARILALARGLIEGVGEGGEGQVEEDDEVVAIGLGAPGPLDARSGRILVTEHLPFVDFPLAPRLEEDLGLPVFLDNDANVAAMGEYLYGAGRGADSLLFLTVSTGIGAGAILDGRILRGHSSNALEAGHMTLEPEGPPCVCGNRGCAEILASGSAIAASAGAALRAVSKGEGPPTSLSRYAAPASKEVFAEAAAGDAVAGAIVDRALYYLGICAANLVTLFDPEVLVVGGGVAEAGAPLFRAVAEAVDSRCARAVAASCRIVPASLGGDAGAIGAAALASMMIGLSPSQKR